MSVWSVPGAAVGVDGTKPIRGEVVGRESCPTSDRTDRADSGFPAKSAGNPCQSGQSPGRRWGLMERSQFGAKWLAGSPVLLPIGQTGLTADFRQRAPEIHVSLVSPRGGGGG